MRVDSIDENRPIFLEDMDRTRLSQLRLDTTFPSESNINRYFDLGSCAWTIPLISEDFSMLTFDADHPDVTISISGDNQTGIQLKNPPLPSLPFILAEDLIQHGSINNLETIIPGEEPGVFVITWIAMDSVYVDHLRWTSCLKWSNPFS